MNDAEMVEEYVFLQPSFTFNTGKRPPYQTFSLDPLNK